MMDDVKTKAALVRALQLGRTGSKDEAKILEIFLGTHGKALTELKNMLEESGDHRDLLQLLYSDIDDVVIRESILSHFAGQASPTGEVKVLSDIDDTFYANWKDERYPKGTIYPGVRQFYRELGGDLTFVTARPNDRVGLIENRTREMLLSKGLERVTVLTGSFMHLLGNDSIAEKKLENFVRYAKLFPEYGFVFVGDSGQGDATFGKGMIESEPERVRAVFIHDVVDTPEAERQRMRGEGIFLFDTYAGAASIAERRGLMSPDSVRRVIESAREELAAISFPAEDQRKARAYDLEKDVSAAGSAPS
jgi:uncharacterized protein DUF2183